MPESVLVKPGYLELQAIKNSETATIAEKEIKILFFIIKFTFGLVMN